MLDIARVAADPKSVASHFSSAPPPTSWQTLLSEIIRGNALGVDRMDYLLRDSLHTGVAYGRFDHHRLIDTLRILPTPSGEGTNAREPQLGVTEGGLHSAEALLLARYFMFTQVYLHPVRRIYDFHLGEFLAAWLPERVFPIDPAEHLKITDAEVIAALRSLARDEDHPAHEAARRIMKREHFKVIWEHNQTDVNRNRNAGQLIYDAACAEFGPAVVRRPPPYATKSAVDDFPVQLRDGRITSALVLSDVLQQLPPIASDAVYVEPGLRDRAREWIDARLDRILEQSSPEED